MASALRFCLVLFLAVIAATLSKSIGETEAEPLLNDIDGRHTGNLENHIRRKHKGEWLIVQKEKERLEKEKKTQEDGQSCSEVNRKRKLERVTIQMNAKRLKEACLELVTVNGRPFTLLEDSGFRMVVDPILEAINSKTDDRITINRQNALSDISKESAKMRETIREEVKGKLVSLKVDTATRLDRQLMSINIQYAQNGKLHIRNLCMKELFCSHTAENLKKEILEALKHFDIKPERVYTGTSDNAKNIVKAVNLLGEEIGVENGSQCHCSSAVEFPLQDNFEDSDFLGVPESDPQQSQQENCGQDTEYVCNFSESDLEEDTEEEAEEELTPEETPKSQEEGPNTCSQCDISNFTLQEMGVIGVRCAAHTLQLAVADAIKLQKSLCAVIKRARKLCKSLRLPSTRALLCNLGINMRKPCLDVPTRWHSSYDMLSSLISLKGASKKVADVLLDKKRQSSKTKGKSRSKSKKKEFENLDDREWLLIENFCDSLKPAKIATKALQAEQLTIGDFYATWLRCKMATEKIHFTLAQDLVSAMEARERELLNTPAFAAGIYMDPRYQVLLILAQKIEAQLHLKALWHRLNRLDANEHAEDQAQETSSSDEEKTNPEDDDLDKLIKRKAAEAQKSGMSLNNDDISKLLSDFSKIPLVDSKVDVLMWWEGRKEKEPELYQLAMTALAVPMTQVSVERTFSHLRQILDILRYKMTPTMINDILFIRCNRILSKC